MDRGKDRRFMEEALRQARFAAEQGEVPVGAVVVREGQILSAAHNLREHHQDPTAHAEVLALRAAAKALGSWRLEGCSLYVTLEPCAMCAGAMVLARVDRCVFGTTDPKGGFLGTLGDLSAHHALNHQFQVERGVCGQEAAALLSDFFRAIRSRKRC